MYGEVWQRHFLDHALQGGSGSRGELFDGGHDRRRRGNRLGQKNGKILNDVQ